MTTSKLPPMTYTFDVTVTGKETGHIFTGTFKYKRPTLGNRSLIEKFYARLCGDLTTLDADVMDFNKAIAHLRFALEDYPDWWRDSSLGLDLYDLNVVSAIYNKCMEYEAEWKLKVFGGDPSKVEEGVTNEIKESVTGS